MFTLEMSSSSLVCKICERQVAKYTCPSCNAPYCALSCFRSPAHGECSEGFYRKEISTGGGAGAKAEERIKMMEMLRRLEAAEDDEDNDDDTDEIDLNARFADVDLDDTEALWERLTPEQRARFMASPFAGLSVKPWWQDEAVSPPPIPDIPNTLTPTPSRGIIYNLVAIMLTYAYACRHLASACLAGNADASNLLARLLPFLAEPQSTFVFSSLDDVVTSLSSREVPAAPLLDDVLILLRPSIVTEPGCHPHDYGLRALGDIIEVLEKTARLRRKILWYAACLKGFIGRGSLLGKVVKEVEDRQRAENESKADDLNPQTAPMSLKIV